MGRIPYAALDVTRPLTAGLRIEAAHLTRRAPGGRRLLDDVSLDIHPGELVAIVGGSGAGKTTLLQALSGVRPADAGDVWFDGVSVYEHLDSFRSTLGYVPQDDIIHAELPLNRTLQYAARLRLNAGATAPEVASAVERVLRQLGLGERADVPVRALSGGQRKRASIAVELLTSPLVFFLDEPTSGLDPATSAELVRLLQALAAGGATVVFTTHSVQDLGYCGRVIFLASGGRVAYVGSVDEALGYFNVDRIEDVYVRLEGNATPDERTQTSATQRGSEQDHARASGTGRPTLPARRAQPEALRQWWILTARTAESLIRNPLTMAILLGSPVMIVVMFAILFQAGAFDFANPSPTAITMILFWVTFAAFFFGVTYGLLQIVTERAILWRETLVGLRLSSYLLSKTAVLLPFLLVVDILMLVVLWALGRLPSASFGTYTSVGFTLALEAAGALTLSLLTSALVKNASQATLALPLLCFPVVLFSGAILPVHVMAAAGAAISTVMPVRWAFEGLGHDFGVRALLQHGHSPLGPPLLQAYGNAGELGIGWYWLYLTAFVVVFLVGAWAVLRRTTKYSQR